jgi:hypothetical protein
MAFNVRLVLTLMGALYAVPTVDEGLVPSVV